MTGSALTASDLAAPPASHARLCTHARDPALRRLYAEAALRQIPRLLGAIDRNPYRSTYGCLDRQYWHYRTSDFPSEMYQEGALALALVYSHPLPGNRWYAEPRVGELAAAAIRFAARSSHRDGSCDDYYPFERALGAAVFSLNAAALSYQLLGLNDAELRAWLIRRARWIDRHDESGRLANHHALAALGLWRVAEITGKAEFREAAERRLRLVLDWQSDEGWFEEYGGADPGYQTVTIDCLASYRALSGDRRLDEPLRRAVAFARLFLHPDGSYGGEYGSRGTYHFYPHGFELLAGENADAADLADGFLRSLAGGKEACFDDDRMYAHRLPSLLQAYLAWAPRRPSPDGRQRRPRVGSFTYLPEARLLVAESSGSRTIVSAARGGVFKHFPAAGRPATEAGLIVELSEGEICVSQGHDRQRQVEWHCGREAAPGAQVSSEPPRLVVAGPLHVARLETATPWKLVFFRVALLLLGRWCRGLVRRLLQRRLITGRKASPVHLTRTFEFLGPIEGRGSLRITDRIELTDARAQVKRASFGVDHQTAYVAAGGVYQESVLQTWTDLHELIPELNKRRQVTIVREL